MWWQHVAAHTQQSILVSADKVAGRRLKLLVKSTPPPPEIEKINKKNSQPDSHMEQRKY